MTGKSRPEDTTAQHLGRPDSLAARLERPQRALAELEHEYLSLARRDDDPDSWRTWADLNTALMAVRAAQGRNARDHSPVIVDSEP